MVFRGVQQFEALLHSMHQEKGYRVFICADEAEVPCEELPHVTLERVGAKHMSSTGGERTMFIIDNGLTPFSGGVEIPTFDDKSGSLAIVKFEWLQIMASIFSLL